MPQFAARGAEQVILVRSYQPRAPTAVPRRHTAGRSHTLPDNFEPIATRVTKSKEPAWQHCHARLAEGIEESLLVIDQKAEMLAVLRRPATPLL